MIGKWNKSVILTYIGMGISILGIYLIINGYSIKYAQICLMIAGICDLFDGTIARMCKRTKEEKEFGVQIDSLVDVIVFIIFPIVILGSLSKKDIYLPLYIIYAIFGIARLAHFNITTENTDKRIEYYEGMPVTYAALILPIAYLLSYIIENSIFIIAYNIILFIIAILYIVKIKVPKPKTSTGIFLIVLGAIISYLYLFVL